MILLDTDVLADIALDSYPHSGPASEQAPLTWAIASMIRAAMGHASLAGVIGPATF